MKRLFARCFFGALLAGVLCGCKTTPVESAKWNGYDGHQTGMDASLKKVSPDTAELLVGSRYVRGNKNGGAFYTIHAPPLLCKVGDDKSYIIPRVGTNMQWELGTLKPGATGIGVRVKLSKDEEAVQADCIIEFRARGDYWDNTMHVLLSAP